MPKTKYSCQVGRLTFHLVRGNIFDVDAQAIVNSEQTDFVLSSDRKSISGRIKELWGRDVQPELDEQTERQTMPLPTVLETRKGRWIYHAGFHDPRVYKYSWDEETDHLHYITSCVREILARAYSSKCQSLALPLIGTGVFQLNKKLVAQKIMECILQFAAHGCLDRDITVSVVLSDAKYLRLCLEATIDAMAERIPVAGLSERFAIGVPFLDRLEARVQRATDPQWKAWQLIAYVEFLTIYMFSVISPKGRSTQEQKLESLKGKTASFGFYRELAFETARTIKTADDEWIEFIAKLLRTDAEPTDQRLERINRDRNDLAHNRVFRPYGEIRRDLDAFLGLGEWTALKERIKEGPPEVGSGPWMTADSEPKMEVQSNAGEPISCRSQVGCLQVLKNRRCVYLNPDSGLTFCRKAPSI